MTYEYEYIRKDGTHVTIERSGIPMGMASEPLEVIDPEDGNRYIAERIISLTSDMSWSWESDVRNSDLPPVNADPADVKRTLDKRKAKGLTS